MLQQRIRQRPNRTKIDGRARSHVLRKYTDATFADVAAKAECTARADGGACGNGTTDGNGLGLRDADYVVAVAVGSGAGVGVGQDGVAQGLNDCFGGFGIVIEGGAGAEAGAAAVDSEGDGDGIEDEGTALRLRMEVR